MSFKIALMFQLKMGEGSAAMGAVMAVERKGVARKMRNISTRLA